jgi:hypothetical protein
VIGKFLKRSIPTLAAERVKVGIDGRYHLLEARRGRGKSYSMTYWAVQGVLAKKPIIANFGLNLYKLAIFAYKKKAFPTLGEAFDWCHSNIKYSNNWDDFLTAYSSLILLDESSRIFDSRSRSAPPIAFEWLQQSRKLKHTIVFASQSFDWLDIRTRQLFDLLWLVRKVVNKKKGVPTKFLGYGFDPWSQGLSEQVDRGISDFLFTIPFDLTIAKCYNTLELIHLLTGEPSYKSVGELDVYFRSKGYIKGSLSSSDVITRSYPADYIAPWDDVPETPKFLDLADYQREEALLTLREKRLRSSPK